MGGFKVICGGTSVGKQMKQGRKGSDSVSTGGWSVGATAAGVRPWAVVSHQPGVLATGGSSTCALCVGVYVSL